MMDDNRPPSAAPTVTSSMINNLMLPVMIAVLSAGLGGLTTWILKLDERVFELGQQIVTQQQLDLAFGRMDSRLGRIEDLLVTVALANAGVGITRPNIFPGGSPSPSTPPASPPR